MSAGLPLHYLSHASIPSAEANSIQVMKMCAAFARRCGAVTLYCRGEAGSAAHAHYGVAPSFRLEAIRGGRVRYVGRALYSLRAYARLRRAAPGGILYGRDYHTLALVALAGAPALPLVLEVHQTPGNALERALQRAIFRSRHFRRLVVISGALEAEYLRLFGTLVDGRITVAHDGADLPGDDVPDAGARAAAPLAAAPLTLGYVGNLYPGKGMELIERLALRLPALAFHVIGGSEREVAHWQERLAAAGGSGNVVFHGRVPHAEAQLRMRACDVLLAPFQRSVWIGGEHADIGRWMSPLKIFEYMGSGRPMIASDLPVLREVLRHGSNALLADPDELEAWVAAIHALAADGSLRQSLAAQARDDLTRHYSWDRRAERILAEVEAPRAVALESAR